MPPRAVESKAIRMPKQYVREGRGVAGYTGNVQTYEVARKSNKPQVVATPQGDIVQPETPVQPEKYDHNKLTRVQLESIASERGISQESMDGAQTKAELVELIEQAGP